MKWGSLLVLAGLLALWAGLQPASGQFSPRVCRLPPETGLCQAYIPMYYYDTATRRCKEFIYGGCGGNGNRFRTEAACLQACGRKPGGDLSLLGGDVLLYPVDLCRLPPETGPCKMNLLRYYYNWVTRTCQQFTYGGCQGNANNFKTRLECENRCKVGGKGLSLPGPDAARGMAAPGRWPDVQGRVKLGRPGRCPQLTGPGICMDQCTNNDLCPQGQKCCSNGCGHECMGAV
ncbi:kunitz-type U19-barytoxin-Tl1a-like isoform X1 [Alligator mississippiensis]|uniref:kunitz-type U19-barytoxin-Tl1a-like isoform X1 n=1 Tax=Alligator mississippiensis TaxID=8496 RepID=UPI00287749AA|nr:kunitz-type U19-barytoxin-Tl1a-like isoform X1 [Alligator mississippiensis]